MQRARSSLIHRGPPRACDGRAIDGDAPAPAFDALAGQALAVFPGAVSASIRFSSGAGGWYRAWAGHPLPENWQGEFALPGALTVVPDIRQDGRFAGHPMVTGLPGIRFYAAAGLRQAQGLIRVLGPQVRTASGSEIAAFTALAGLVECRLALHQAVEGIGH